jgi:DNA-binding sugar fermentation-stimulating protein
MSVESKPLISATTGNKLLLTILLAATTALTGWLVNATLETKRNELLILKEVEWLHDWLQENEDDLNYTNQRIDILMEMITSDMMLREIKQTRKTIDGSERKKANDTKSQ